MTVKIICCAKRYAKRSPYLRRDRNDSHLRQNHAESLQHVPSKQPALPWRLQLIGQVLNRLRGDDIWAKLNGEWLCVAVNVSQSRWTAVGIPWFSSSKLNVQAAFSIVALVQIDLDRTGLASATAVACLAISQMLIKEVKRKNGLLGAGFEILGTEALSRLLREHALRRGMGKASDTQPGTQ